MEITSNLQHFAALCVFGSNQSSSIFQEFLLENGQNFCPKLFLSSGRLAAGERPKIPQNALLSPQRRAVDLIITGWLRLFSPPTQNRGRFALISSGLSLSTFAAMEGLPRRGGCIDPNSIDLLAVNSRGWQTPAPLPLRLTPLSRCWPKCCRSGSAKVSESPKMCGVRSRLPN